MQVDNKNLIIDATLPGNKQIYCIERADYNFYLACTCCRVDLATKDLLKLSTELKFAGYKTNLSDWYLIP